MLDYWLCRVMLPALPANVRVVIGGRNAPFERWRSYGPLLCPIPLGNLSPEEADELLRRSGVDADDGAAHQRRRPRPPAEPPARRRDAARPARAWRSRRSPPAPSARSWRACTSTGWTRRPRRALNAAALTRRTTLSLLAAMLPDEPATEAFARLRDLPFVELTAGGLLVHDTVREATAALLRAADPQEYWRLRAAAWSCLRAELRGAPRRELPRYTADLMYLIEEESVRRAFFPAAAGEQLVRPAHGGRPAGDGGPRARGGRRPARVVGGGARRVHRRLQGHGRRGGLRLPHPAGRREPARDRRRPAGEPLARAPAQRPDPARPAGALPALGRPHHGRGGTVRPAARRDARLHGAAARAAAGLRARGRSDRHRPLVRDHDRLPAARGRAGHRVHGLRPRLGRGLARRARRPPAARRRRGRASRPA